MTTGEEAEETEQPINKTFLRKMKMEELRAFVKERGLDAADTKKDELIEEILEALEAEE